MLNILILQLSNNCLPNINLVISLFFNNLHLCYFVFSLIHIQLYEYFNHLINSPVQLHDSIQKRDLVLKIKIEVDLNIIFLQNFAMYEFLKCELY